jgi:polyisoprenoid-binding protein YceI
MNAFGQSLTVKSDEVRVEFLTVAQKTSGTVSGFEATINFNSDSPASSSISGTVDVSTLETGNNKRDNHLKSDDFFDAENHPKMSFESTSIEKTDEGYVMTGKLTIEDQTHEETITFTFSDNIFRGEMTISMANYDLGMFSKKKGDKSNATIKFTIPVK